MKLHEIHIFYGNLQYVKYIKIRGIGKQTLVHVSYFDRKQEYTN